MDAAGAPQFPSPRLLAAEFSVTEAPNSFACASFSSDTSMAVTIAPSPRPICTARCPKPPTPKTAKRWPGLILGVLQGAIDRDARTEKRRSVNARESVWNFQWHDSRAL